MARRTEMARKEVKRAVTGASHPTGPDEPVERRVHRKWGLGMSSFIIDCLVIRPAKNPAGDVNTSRNLILRVVASFHQKECGWRDRSTARDRILSRLW